MTEVAAKWPPVIKDSWGWDLTPSRDPVESETNHVPYVDRSELAAETAEVLAALDLNDKEARIALANRLLDAGIQPTMHAGHPASPMPALDITTDMSLREAASVSEHNLAVLTENVQAVKTWPRDKQIEYVLGQLIPLLHDPIPKISDKTATWIRRDLHDLA